MGSAFVLLLTGYWGSTQSWCDSCAFGGYPLLDPRHPLALSPFIWSLGIGGGQAGRASQPRHPRHPVLPALKPLPCRRAPGSASPYCPVLALQVSVRLLGSQAAWGRGTRHTAAFIGTSIFTEPGLARRPTNRRQLTEMQTPEA